MNAEMWMTIGMLLEEIREELHTQNVINAERSMALECAMQCTPPCDLLSCTREFLNNNAKGASNGRQ